MMRHVIAILLLLLPASGHASIPECLRLLTEKHLRYEDMSASVASPRMTETELVEVLEQAGVLTHSNVRKALAQAQASHRAHARDDGSNYLEQHIYPVTTSVVRELLARRSGGRPPSRKEGDTVAGALLHDVLEDDPSFTRQKIRREFGSRVASLVLPLTKPDYRAFPGETSQQKKWEMNRHYIANLATANRAARLIKLADRLNNVISTRALVEAAPELAPHERKVVFYILETETFYLPLARATSRHYHERLDFHLDRLKERFTDWESTRAEALASYGGGSR